MTRDPGGAGQWPLFGGISLFLPTRNLCRRVPMASRLWMGPASVVPVRGDRLAGSWEGGVFIYGTGAGFLGTAGLWLDNLISLDKMQRRFMNTEEPIFLRLKIDGRGGLVLHASQMASTPTSLGTGTERSALKMRAR